MGTLGWGFDPWPGTVGLGSGIAAALPSFKTSGPGAPYAEGWPKKKKIKKFGLQNLQQTEQMYALEPSFSVSVICTLMV